MYKLFIGPLDPRKTDLKLISEPERECISSSLESSGLSRSLITWQPHMRNLCSQSRKENVLVHLSSLRVWVVRSSRDSPICVTYAVRAGKRMY